MALPHLASDSGDSIDRYTNRGNKLKRKARYVQERQLDRPNGPKVYKKRIEHAGYHRDVISQNPKRYDVDGYQLEDDEEDEEADIAAAEANPYSGVVLHELLAPLASAADLPTHPSLSVPYLAPILGNMTQEACQMLQRERNTIRGVKQILTKLRGDDTWTPCGSLDSEVDDMIFDTNKVYEECVRLRPLSKLTQSKENVIAPTTTSLQFGDTVERRPTLAQTKNRSVEGEGDSAPSLTQANGHNPISLLMVPTTLLDKPSGTEPPEKISSTTMDGHGDTTVRHDFEASRATITGQLRQSGDREASSLEAPKLTTQTAESMIDENSALAAETEAGTRDIIMESKGSHQSAREQIPEVEEKRSPSNEETRDGPHALSLDAKEDLMLDAEGPEVTSNDLQPMPHRMTTRAQAQAVSSENTTSSRTRSPSVASSLLPSIHPLFLMPNGACPDRDFGLPPDEAEATRRILMSYVQKQEEVCRGAEKLYDGFLKAQRMKKDVLDSCKAEGHLGEMSDGEDWIDKEEWGLEEDLRKGRDEDEDDVGTQHKKTRGRRAA
ncbi:MAG: hypothetical protein Q9221_000590 [Calogaya cf. arnoldii]